MFNLALSPSIVPLEAGPRLLRAKQSLCYNFCFPIGFFYVSQIPGSCGLMFMLLFWPQLLMVSQYGKTDLGLSQIVNLKPASPCVAGRESFNPWELWFSLERGLQMLPREFCRLSSPAGIPSMAVIQISFYLLCKLNTESELYQFKASFGHSLDLFLYTSSWTSVTLHLSICQMRQSLLPMSHYRK